MLRGKGKESPREIHEESGKKCTIEVVTGRGWHKRKGQWRQKEQGQQSGPEVSVMLVE